MYTSPAYDKLMHSRRPLNESFISSVTTWTKAVAALSSPPLIIFTRVYFSPGHPEIAPATPFATAAAALLSATSTSPLTQIYPTFDTTGTTILQKPRYYAGTSNALEEILSTQGIDTGGHIGYHSEVASECDHVGTGAVCHSD
jgi:hypothetical protein